MKNIFKILQNPYPLKSAKSMYTSFVFISTFIVLFLIIFEPWGISFWQNAYKYYYLSGYGLLTLIVLIVFYQISSLFIKEENWKVWKEISSIVAIVSIISICNIIYSTVVGIMDFNITLMLKIVVATFLLAFFPAIIGTIINYNRYNIHNLKNAENINKIIEENRHIQQIKEEKSNINQSIHLNLIAENGKDCIKIIVNDLLYIETADNYSKIVFIENNQLKNILFRCNLKQIESQNNFSFIARCHRSFIINLKHSINIEGNAQGYKIHLNQCDEKIPVSRNYSQTILEKLKQLDEL